MMCDKEVTEIYAKCSPVEIQSENISFVSSFFTHIFHFSLSISYLYVFLPFSNSELRCTLIMKMAQFAYRAATCERTGELYVCMEMA
jgi:hypothetical protein